MGNVQTAASAHEAQGRKGARHRLAIWSPLAGRTARRWAPANAENSKAFLQPSLESIESVVIWLLVVFSVATWGRPRH